MFLQAEYIMGRQTKDITIQIIYYVEWAQTTTKELFKEEIFWENCGEKNTRERDQRHTEK